MKIIQKATQKVGKKLKLGGSIQADVRKLDVYTPGFDYKQILRDAALLSGPPRPKEFLHGSYSDDSTEYTRLAHIFANLYIRGRVSQFR